jgi:hypothetical protein
VSDRFPALGEWFRIQFDEATISLCVNPPNRSAWAAQISWDRIVRVCFNAGDLENPDEIYIFTDERPESYLIPIEASGGDALWDEIIHRKLFDAEVAIKAMSSINTLFCCPDDGVI